MGISALMVSLIRVSCSPMDLSWIHIFTSIGRLSTPNLIVLFSSFSTMRMANFCATPSTLMRIQSELISSSFTLSFGIISEKRFRFSRLLSTAYTCWSLCNICPILLSYFVADILLTPIFRVLLPCFYRQLLFLVHDAHSRGVT